ncbi:hypothetical protein M0802_003417 [Mischocyttarus mexicanus]|nr:hypothetical protein M0802_003417 [Mischocyttarus mexicanus]
MYYGVRNKGFWWDLKGGGDGMGEGGMGRSPTINPTRIPSSLYLQPTLGVYPECSLDDYSVRSGLSSLHKVAAAKLTFLVEKEKEEGLAYLSFYDEVIRNVSRTERIGVSRDC